MKNFTFKRKVKATIEKGRFLVATMFLIAIFAVGSNQVAAQTDCCPEFKIKDAVEICPAEGACNIDVPGGQADKVMAACKESAHVYTVYPNDAAYSYTWAVNGGTIATNLGNPKVIVWGTGSVGYIKVVISNLATGGTCLDSITAQICLIDGPEANFITDQDTVCVNTAVHFTNLSLGGSVYLWDFGDGITSTLANPLDHPYTNPGTYTVTLTATDMGAGHWVQVFQLEDSILMQVPCGCSDTITKKIVVLPGEGPKIETDCCYGTVCAGDTSSFCTTPPPPGCPTYNWTVTGGTIISGVGTSCVSVKWSPTYIGPTTISLETPGCGTAPCEGTTTLNVPVFYTSFPISGPLTLCQGASGTFSLPTLPGTYYNWTVSGGGYQFNLQDRNTPSVNITFFDATSYTVKCEYNNPLANCGPGTSTFDVDVLPEFVITYGEEQVCEGTTWTYYTNGDATWSVSPIGPTIVPGTPPSSLANITWNSPGTYTITATAVNPANFCNINAIKVVEVIAKPVLDPIAGNDSVCPGENVTYSISSDKKDQTFVWAISGGTGGTIQTEMGSMHDSVVVQWMGAGPWQLSVYQKGEPGVSCDSDPMLLNVFPFLAPVISGATNVCVDASEVYTAGGSNPSGDFDWSISPAAQGTIQSGQGTNSVTILWHGPSASATLSVTSCTGSDTHSINITGRPVADVSYSTLPVFCQGDATILTLSTPFGPYTYDWYEVTTGSEGVYTNTLNITISSLSVGTHQYYVLVKENGCEFKSNIVDVIIKNCVPGTPGGPPGPNGCGVICWFWPYVECDKVTLIDKSTAQPGTINSWLWSVSPAGSFDNPIAQNPVLTVPVSGPYTITLVVTSSAGCTSTYTKIVDILLPNASFTYTAPLCDNAPISFTASPFNPTYNYAWDFGDGFTSFTPNTEHTYGPPAPTSYTVSLVISNDKGCVANASQTITVNPSPVCTITASDTIFCPGSFETLTAPCGGVGWGYQWYKNGKLIPGANISTFDVYEHGEYHVVVSNTTGCFNASNKIYMYMKPLPLAKLTGDGHICDYPASISGVYLIANYDINYIYSWSCNPNVASFSPATSNATWASLTLPGVLPATYEFIVEVTDTTTGCVNSDTLCVTFYEKPMVNFFPFTAQCEGTPLLLTPTLDDFSKYTYQWNTGETTPTIMASNPGHYSLTVTDKIGGCQTTADAAIIFSKPDLSLFPLGCATICPPDILNLYIPLPLNAWWPNDTYSSAYPSITWYDNGNYGSPVGYGETFNFPASGTGSHEFSVVVQNSFGCVDTVGVFCLTDNAVCCEIIAAINQTDASCLQSADGSFSVFFDPTSTVSPFWITQLSPPGPTWGPIAAGSQYTVPGLSPGVYVFSITDASGRCEDIIDVEIGFLQEECCFAEVDSSFIHILNDTIFYSDVVWDNKYYIDDGVMVTMAGAMFDITNVDVVFGECAGIEFVNGGYLRANNSVFRPCDIDKSWRGLRFDAPGEFDNIVNESTFKNAEVALYFKGGSDAVVSSGLFSNCNYGIRVEGNDNFNHPISGNRFVSDDFFPNFACPTKYSFVNNNVTFGIYSEESRFVSQVSHNEFINSTGTAWPSTYGIYQVYGGGVFSENTFTDIGTAVTLIGQMYYSSVENNEIEMNLQTLNNSTSIFVVSCNGPVIEVLNNEITNNYSQWVSFSAIYAAHSTNLSIVNNEIDGFNFGIINVGATNHQISNNVINDTRFVGIYVQEQPYSTGYITCNSIKMRDYNGSLGILGINMSSMSEVSSNCITDCYTSMSFNGSAWTGNPAILPLIRNNFLYNYAYVGINVNGCSGNIGTQTDPGLNTLWSNNNTATDINSNTSITVADNFGMFNISVPWVQITSNNPYHSTASCGHQIFNMPSQGNLNINYACDNSARIYELMTGAGGNYFLAADYQETLKSSPTPFEHANMIMASVENPDMVLLNEIIQLTDLTINQEALLMYNFYYRNGDYQNARASMEMFAPLTRDEQNYKTLSIYDLDAIAYGWDEFSDGDIETMEMIVAEEAVYANLSISLLNNVSGYRDHITEEVVLPNVMWTDNIKRVETDGSYLNIYPNPVTNTAYIEFIDNTDGNSKIELFDVNGKLLTDISLSMVAGGIEMDVQQLRGGIYFVTITNPGSGYIQKGKLVKVDNQ